MSVAALAWSKALCNRSRGACRNHRAQPTQTMPQGRRKLIHDIDSQVARRWIAYNDFDLRSDSNRKRAVPYALHLQVGSARQPEPVDEKREEEHSIPDHERIQIGWVPEPRNQPCKACSHQQEKTRPSSCTETAVPFRSGVYRRRCQLSGNTHFGT